MNRDELSKQLVIDEGLRLKPYRCTDGKLTFGVGRNLDDVVVSKEEAMMLLSNDIASAIADLDRCLPWWSSMSDKRQQVLANMCLNMGIGNSKKGLLSFRNTLASMERKDYKAAAKGMRDSAWFKQVGARAERLAKMMEDG